MRTDEVRRAELPAVGEFRRRRKIGRLSFRAALRDPLPQLVELGVRERRSF
jgi:hypothetical protein